MSFAEDIRLLIADYFIKDVSELEKTGVRRDVVLDGLERALKLLRDRERTVEKVGSESGASAPAIRSERIRSL